MTNGRLVLLRAKVRPVRESVHGGPFARVHRRHLTVPRSAVGSAPPVERSGTGPLPPERNLGRGDTSWGLLLIPIGLCVAMLLYAGAFLS